MKRILVTAAILCAGALWAAPAFGLEIHVRLYSSEVMGVEGVAGAAIQVILADDYGTTKAWVNETADGSGYWSADFPPGVVIMPDDRLTVWENTTTYQLVKIPKINVDGIAVRTDVVRGRIVPRRSEVEIHVVGDRLTAGGWSYDEFEMAVPTAEDGSFTADLTSQGDLKRFDEVYVGDVEGPFLIYNLMFAPGFQITMDTSIAIMGGRRGSTYDLELIAPNGRVKDTTSTTLGEMFHGMGLVEFSKANGKPVPIRSRDRVKAIGPWGFTDRVEPLSLSVDIAADTFEVKARPNAVLQLAVEGHSVFRTADAEGDLLFDWSSVGYDVQPRDECSVIYQDRQGNMVRLAKQALAP